MAVSGHVKRDCHSSSVICPKPCLPRTDLCNLGRSSTEAPALTSVSSACDPHGTCLCFLFLEVQQGTCGETSSCLFTFPRWLEHKAQPTADVKEGRLYSHNIRFCLYSILNIGRMEHADHRHEPDKEGTPLAVKKGCVCG